MKSKGKVLFHLGHPAHFHLFRNTFKFLEEKGYESLIIIKKKDILEDLVKGAGLSYFNILPERRGGSKFQMVWSVLIQSYRLLLFCLKTKPKALIGSTPNVAQVGKVLGIQSINLGEDDVAAIPLYAKITYPFSSIILSPVSCDNGKWNKKTLAYPSYQELAYLHPNHFKPDYSVVEKYLGNEKTFFVLRFSGLNAYHDEGIEGMGLNVSRQIIQMLLPLGRIIITSERPLNNELEQYRLPVDPLDMHNLLHFATLFIGDSQTMAAEAGVLGTPFIRINDFVGRLGYLNELEHVYKLGFGILPKDVQTIFPILESLLEIKDIKQVWHERRMKMLEDRIDFNGYFNSFLIKQLEHVN
jgi:predicted glycosyltransferase